LQIWFISDNKNLIFVFENGWVFPFVDFEILVQGLKSVGVVERKQENKSILVSDPGGDHVEVLGVAWTVQNVKQVALTVRNFLPLVSVLQSLRLFLQKQILAVSDAKTRFTCSRSSQHNCKINKTQIINL
jgi:hypothetical protein